MKKRLAVILLILLGYAGWQAYQAPVDGVASVTQGDTRIAEAFAARKGDVQVQGRGVVIKVLPDDTRGSRHQRFILRLDSGQTLLVAHNIDLADRVAGLGKGDEVEFFGEYEWNAKGGVLHWTHADPGGRHVAGWLKHKGSTYGGLK